MKYLSLFNLGLGGGTELMLGARLGPRLCSKKLGPDTEGRKFAFLLGLGKILHKTQCLCISCEYLALIKESVSECVK